MHLLCFVMPEFVDRPSVERTPKQELIRVNPETIPYEKDPLNDSIISKHVGSINEQYSLLRRYKGLDYAMLIGGETLLSMRMKRDVDIITPSEKEHRYPVRILGSNGLSRPFNTGVDLNYLIENHPNDRWKFYLSMDMTNPKNDVKVISFFKELVERCKKQKVSLTAKTWDHDYDKPDIYTWQPITMQKILQELYSDPRFSEIWFNTPHYFQNPIQGVSADHIGMVQEPICGLKGDSHSARMFALGEKIDRRISEVGHGGRIGFLTFYDAARQSGVEPTQPWRILRSLLAENEKHAKKITKRYKN
jgi:hypothetical protein